MVLRLPNCLVVALPLILLSSNDLILLIRLANLWSCNFLNIHLVFWMRDLTNIALAIFFFLFSVTVMLIKVGKLFWLLSDYVTKELWNFPPLMDMDAIMEMPLKLREYKNSEPLQDGFTIRTLLHLNVISDCIRYGISGRQNCFISIVPSNLQFMILFLSVYTIYEFWLVNHDILS